MIKRATVVRGFTLVDLIVSTAIFVTVITISVGALFSAQSVNTKLEQTQTILDGVNLATEVIVRDMRYGSNFYCDTVLPSSVPTVRKGCPHPTGGSVLIFRPTSPLAGTTNETLDRVAYFLQNGLLYKNEYPYGGVVRTSQITSSDVSITKLSFYGAGLNTTSGTIDYANVSDYNQPLITMVLSGVTVPTKKTTTPVTFTVQTSASSRAIDK